MGGITALDGPDCCWNIVNTAQGEEQVAGVCGWGCLNTECPYLLNGCLGTLSSRRKTPTISIVSFIFTQWFGFQVRGGCPCYRLKNNLYPPMSKYAMGLFVHRYIQ